MPNDWEVFAATVGLIEAVKKAFGLKGSQATATGIIVGFLLGVSYHWAKAQPVLPPEWFAVVFSGLTLALSAVGLYAVGDKAITKVSQGLAHRDPEKPRK